MCKWAGGGQHTTLLESASVGSSRFCTKCGEPAGTNSSSPGCRVHTLGCAMANRGWSLTALSRSVQATQRVRTGSSRLVCGWPAPAGLMSNVGSSPCACVHRGYSNGICLRLKNVHLCSEGTRLGETPLAAWNCGRAASAAHRFLPLSSAIQKALPKASTCSALKV